MKPRIRLLITDLDNTIYDWLAAFVPAFYAMVGEASRILGESEDRILDELQSVHVRHHDSEHPFALLETDVVALHFPFASQAEIRTALDPAFHAFNSMRKQNLHLYRGVLPVLEALAKRDVPVVGYTDARVISSLFRLTRLDVRKFFSTLYAPGHLTKEVGEEIVKDEFVRILPPRDRKPNPQTLLDICASYGVTPNEAVYVGDSLSRDVFMANEAGVHSAWAKYGGSPDPELWAKLVRVTHWTNADIEADRALRERTRSVRPQVELNHFDDLLTLFDFDAAA